MFLFTIQEYLGKGLVCYDVGEFHVTFEVPGHNLHFYYHEKKYNSWMGAGYTSTKEVERLGWNLNELRQSADEVAKEFVKSIQGTMSGRDKDLPSIENG